MKVYLIGAGPGDAGLLTLKGRDALACADVVVYDALANDSLLGHARPDAERIYVGKVAGNHALPQHEINALLVRKAKEGKVVARLKGGDPYIFGRGGEEAEELLAAGVPFEEVPGISSTIAAPAYAGIPLTHRNFASSVTIITGHENPDKPGSVHNWKALAASASTLVFVMGMKNLPDIARHLLDAGMDPDTPAALVYRGTTPYQRSLVATISTLPQAAVDNKFSNPSVIVVGKVCSLHDQLGWFEQRPLYGRSIVVTRAREQASGLAQSLTELGANVIQCPTIEISPLADYSELDAAVARLAEYGWIIFTSVNGVRHFWKRLAACGRDSRAIGRCKVAAIGPATADALRERHRARLHPGPLCGRGRGGRPAGHGPRVRRQDAPAPRRQGPRSAARRAAQGRGAGGRHRRLRDRARRRPQGRSAGRHAGRHPGLRDLWLFLHGGELPFPDPGGRAARPS